MDENLFMYEKEKKFFIVNVHEYIAIQHFSYFLVTFYSKVSLLIGIYDFFLLIII